MLCICIFSCVIYSFLTITLWGGYSYPHCIAEETEAQRSSETCPRSHNLLLSESQFEVILNPQPACTFNHHAISPVKSVIQQQAYTGCFQVGIHFYFKNIYIYANLNYEFDDYSSCHFHLFLYVRMHRGRVVCKKITISALFIRLFNQLSIYHPTNQFSNPPNEPTNRSTNQPAILSSLTINWDLWLYLLYKWRA